MAELFSAESVQSEVADIARAIEARRETITLEHGIHEEHEIVHHVVGEEFFGKQTSPSTSPSHTHYLDNLSDEEKETLNHYIGLIPGRGIARAIDAVRNEHPLLIDAFHDVLADKLYTELKTHGLVE